MMRLRLVTAVAAIGCLLVAAWPSPVVARTTECRIAVNGEPITTMAGGRVLAQQSERPIVVPIDADVRLRLQAEGEPESLRIGLRFGPLTVPLPPGPPPTPGRYSEPIGQYALFGAGLYNVVGAIDACEFSAWVNVVGPSPFLTIPGVLGTLAIVIGLAGGLSGLLAAMRRGPRRALWRSVFGGALTGAGALVVAQQAGVAPIDTANLVSWTGGPAAAAGLAHVALGAVVAPLRGETDTDGGPYGQPVPDMGWDPRAHGRDVPTGSALPGTPPRPSPPEPAPPWRPGRVSPTPMPPGQAARPSPSPSAAPLPPRSGGTRGTGAQPPPIPRAESPTARAESPTVVPAAPPGAAAPVPPARAEPGAADGAVVCWNCGSANAAGRVFCGTCGSLLSGPAAAPPGTPAAPVAGRPAVPEAAAPTPEQRPPRYAVIEVFHGDGEPGTERGPAAPPDEPLVADRWYAVDISVRTAFSGVPVAGSAPRGVEEPSATEEVRITVLALSEDFEIAEPVRTFRLPAQGNSRPATFEVRAKGPSQSGIPARIRFQLLYRLNLIEDIELQAVVVAAAAAPSVRVSGALVLRYARVHELVGLDALTEKQMRIHVARSNGSFVFYFVVRPEGQDVIFTGRTSPRLAEVELEHLLTRVRLALLAIAVTRNDGQGPPLPGASFTSRRDGRQLAQAGEEMWTALFRRERLGALSAIGHWLADRPLEVGSVVQVTVDEAAGQFVFPWNLLYDRPLPDDELTGADLDAFWGMRYVIEQHLPPLKHHAPTVMEEPFRRSSLTTFDGARLSASLIVGDFNEAAEQAAFLAQAQADGRLRRDGLRVIERADEALEELKKGDSNLICFFTHGHTALRQGHFGAASLLSPLPDDGPSGADFGERADRWRRTYEQIRSTLAGEGESWIMPRHGLIRLSRLYTLDVDELAGSPLVLLNMCESAQVVPSLSGSFVDYFIDRGARAVLGTETSTTPRFAHHFAERLLSRFLSGAELGMALLDTRRDYREQGDVFGLVYSLFGAGTVRVTTGSQQAAPADKQSGKE